MPRIRYIGYPSRYLGKHLLWLLGNLKNFGVGRIVTRGIYERYPEPTYYTIKRVVPYMDDENRFGDVWVEHVFRGKKLPGEQLLEGAHFPDYRLVPKSEEHRLLSIPLDQTPPRVLPRKIPFAPLLRMMIERDMRAKGLEPTEEPMMEAVYKDQLTGTYRRAEEGETPDVDFIGQKRIFERFRRGVVDI